MARQKSGKMKSNNSRTGNRKSTRQSKNNTSTRRQTPRAGMSRNENNEAP